MARIAAGERGEDSETIFAAEAEARTGRDPFVLTVRRPVRYWSDGALIGSELFVREMAARLLGTKRALGKLGPGPFPGPARRAAGPLRLSPSAHAGLTATADTPKPTASSAHPMAPARSAARIAS